MQFQAKGLKFLDWFEAGASTIDFTADKVHFKFTPGQMEVFLFYEELAIYKKQITEGDDQFYKTFNVNQVTSLLRSLGEDEEIEFSEEGFRWRGAHYSFDEAPVDNLEEHLKLIYDLQGDTNVSSHLVEIPALCGTIASFMGKREFAGMLYADATFICSNQSLVASQKCGSVQNKVDLKFPESLIRIFQKMGKTLPEEVTVKQHSSGWNTLEIDEVFIGFQEVGLPLKSVQHKDFKKYHHDLVTAVPMETFGKALDRMAVVCRDNPSDAMAMVFKSDSEIDVMSTFKNQSQETIAADVGSNMVGQRFLFSVRELKKILSTFSAEEGVMMIGSGTDPRTASIIRFSNPAETRQFFVRVIEDEEE
jgi:hypothetical protein